MQYGQSGPVLRNPDQAVEEGGECISVEERDECISEEKGGECILKSRYTRWSNGFMVQKYGV